MLDNPRRQSWILRFWWRWGTCLCVIVVQLVASGFLAAIWTAKTRVEHERVRAFAETKSERDRQGRQIRTLCVAVLADRCPR